MNTDPELGDNLDALEALAHMGYLDEESVAFKVTLKRLHEGEDSLSEKQRYLFNTRIRPIIAQKCRVCGDGIDLLSVVNAYEAGKMLCKHHLHQYQKNH